MSRRQSDDDGPDLDFQRVDSRIFSRDGIWFFASREGDAGPFNTEAEAAEQLEDYVMLIDLEVDNEYPVTPDF